jgi:exopolysaccharide biosynthesis operon protein EpsL
MKGLRYGDAGKAALRRKPAVGIRHASSLSTFARFVAATALPVFLYAAESCAAPPQLPEGLQFFLTGEALHDNNLFRLPDGDPRTFGVAADSRSDTITRLGAALKYDKLLSRQHVIAEVGIQRNTFAHNDNLDHTASNAGAKWLWQAGEQWDGELSYDFRRRLVSFADVRDNVKNLVDQDTVVATAGYRLHPRWRVWGGVNALQTDNSSPTQLQNDTQIQTALLGIDYRTPSENSIGLQLSRSEGRFPNRDVVASQLVDNQYTETSSAIAWAWALTGKSHFDGTLGYTVREHEQFSARDYRGPTFRVRYAWLPTGKIRIDANAWRELWTAESQTSSYVVASGVRLTPVWFVTSKVTLSAALSYETRSYQGDPGVVLGVNPVRDDTLRALRLSAGYAVLRNAEILLALETGSRDSNQPGFQYDYTSALVNLKIGF